MGSPSPISVSVRPARSMSRCQSALLRASRDTSSPSTRPTRASATSAVRRAKPDRATDPILRPAKLTCLGRKRILTLGRLAIVLDLGGAGLAQIDDRLAGEVVGT